MNQKKRLLLVKQPAFVRTLQGWEVNVYLLNKLVAKIITLRLVEEKEKIRIEEFTFMVLRDEELRVVGLTPVPYVGTPTELETAVLEFARQDADGILTYATNIY